jgi:hypothetical protein
VKAGGKQSFHAEFFDIFFDPEDEGYMLLRNVD